VPLPVVGAGSPPNSIAWAKAYLSTKWHLDPSNRLATLDMAWKVGWGLLCPFRGEGVVGSPSNTVWPVPRPIPPFQVAF